MLSVVIIFVETSNKRDAVTDITTAPKLSLPQHSKCSYRTDRDRITHIFTIPLTTNHVSRSKCNVIEVHIHRVINSVPNFIECNDVFDARIISLKHHYPVEGFAKTIGIWYMSNFRNRWENPAHFNGKSHAYNVFVAFNYDLIIQKCRICFTSARPSHLVSDQ